MNPLAANRKRLGIIMVTGQMPFELVAFDSTHAVFEPADLEVGHGYHAQLTLGQNHWTDLGSPRLITVQVKGA